MSSRRRRILGLAAAAAGTVAAGAVAGAFAEKRLVGGRRGAAQREGFGELRSAPVTVVADDGVNLHAEIDATGPATEAGDADEPTLVFVHGYALNLDCWHFQREHFRGRRRMVFYDQRSHGRSGRSSKENATIDQLGHDLRSVLDQLVPEGPVVLIGHSMGGMTIMALADHHPELFGDRVVGAALISTTAGGLKPHALLSPLLPDRLMGQITPRVVAGLARAPGLVDGARRAGSDIGFLATSKLAFGDEVPASYVEFVDEMLAQTSFDVLAEFFPNFGALDKYAVLHAFERIPTTVVCGDRDRLTSIGLSRKLASLIPGAQLVECLGAGHMVILERREQVNRALDRTLDQVAGHDASSRAS
jgi:pimeloyl-ACP methyl ester carboxylesterase